MVGRAYAYHIHTRQSCYPKGDIRMNLKNCRHRAKMTQRDIAGKLNVTDQTVYRWESGSRAPSIKTIKELAKILDCTMDELLSD